MILPLTSQISHQHTDVTNIAVTVTGDLNKIVWKLNSKQLLKPIYKQQKYKSTKK